MLTEEVKKMPPIDRLLYWIRERRQIYRKKKLGKTKPWTNDRILQETYFCCVEREQDKTTVWFRENVRNSLKDNPVVVFAVICFRWFNYIPTGEILRKYGLLLNWNTAACINALKGEPKIFTGAFNISNGGSTKSKLTRVTEDYIQPVWEYRDKVFPLLVGVPMSVAFQSLSKLPGLGGSGFMAAQVICDLAYTNVLENAPDWWAWCSWGPGSKRGMNRVHSLPVDFAMPKMEWHKRLNDLRLLVKKQLGLELHARDVQNCLCEFDKYERVLWGEGKSKRGYKGYA